MKKFTLITLAVALAAFAIGCTSTANTNANMKANTMNSNTAVVVNSSNSNMSMNTNMAMTNSNRYGSNMSRADYEKNEAEYKADQAKSTIGTGANDKWLWFKTRAALLATNDLRESTIDVDVNNDVVTLKGSVATKEQSAKAASVAKGVEGVKSVTNSLKVQANDSMTNHMTNGNSSMTDGNRFQPPARPGNRRRTVRSK
jgi:hyperosmotically inducible protein